MNEFFVAQHHEVDFLPDEPAHVFHGYGQLEVSEVMPIEVTGMNKRQINTVRSGVYSYGKYHNKKFKTRTKNNLLYVKRII